MKTIPHLALRIVCRIFDLITLLSNLLIYIHKIELVILELTLFLIFFLEILHLILVLINQVLWNIKYVVTLLVVSVEQFFYNVDVHCPVVFIGCIASVILEISRLVVIHLHS